MAVKVFKFRLEKLLNIKKGEEKKLKGEFFSLKRELIDIIEKIDSKNNEIESAFYISKEETSKDIRMFEKWQRYIYLLKQQRVELTKLKNIKGKEVEKKKSELLEKIKERKSLEILREKKYLDYLKELNREEQNFIDEINTSRYKREE